jgi:uncharacterized protein YndB with AHSA1/START domain
MIAFDSSDTTGVEIDRDSCTIRMERRFGADRAQVFEAWTTPEQVACWWDPAGEPLASCEIDLRIGGSFSFVSRAHPEMPFSGVYREIVRPERLVFEALGSTGRVVLDDAADGTRMIVEIVCASQDHLDQFLKMGVHAGTSKTLDNLVAFIGGSPATVRGA